MAKKNNDFSIDDLIDEYSSNGEMVMHSTGIRAFDQMMGGGLMEGAMYGFWGEQGTGKSSLCAQIARKFCEEGYPVLYIDSEKSLNDMQKKIYGLTEYCEDKTLLHFDKVVTMKQCDEVCSKLIKANAVKLIIIDSETELLAKTADELDVESKVVGEHARQSQVLLSKLKCGVHLNNLIAIVMFQARANIQLNPTYGASDKKQAGGYAGRHVPDAIIQIAKGMAIKDSEGKQIGHVMRIKSDKNKIAPPTTIEQNFIYGVGISNKAGVIDAALERGLIEITGHSYILGNGNKYVGKKALYDMTEEDFKFLDEMLNED